MLQILSTITVLPLRGFGLPITSTGETVNRTLGYEWTRAAFERAAIRAGRASSKLTTVESMLAGALAGSATVLITNPIWVVNTRMTARQNNTEELLPGSRPTRKPSTLATLIKLFREEGPSALFAGVLPALVLVINPILQYTIFEQLKNAMEKRRRVLPRDVFVLGALGKLAATSITYPYITVKSRMHVAGGEGPKDNVVGSLRRIVQEEGWRGLYKGGFFPLSLPFPFSMFSCKCEVNLTRTSPATLQASAPKSPSPSSPPRSSLRSRTRFMI